MQDPVLVQKWEGARARAGRTAVKVVGGADVSARIGLESRPMPPTPSAGGRRNHGLDGLRGCAIVLVMAGHCALPPLAGVAAAGVTVFFVLSGYLITTTLLEAGPAADRSTLARFYARRARRLLPALGLLLLFELVLRLGSNASVLPVLLAAGYVTNLAAASGFSSTLDHTWSLALEEQFYVIWPFLLPALWRRRRGLAAIFMLAGLAMAFRIAAASTGYWLVAWFSPVARADAILIGCAAAILLARGRSLPRGVVGTVLIGTAVAVLVLQACYPDRRSTSVLMTLVALATAVLIARLVRPDRGLVTRALSLAPLRWTGRISYGMYLWQPLALAVVTMLDAAALPRFLLLWALSGVFAAVSWFGLERHFLRHDRQPVLSCATKAPAIVDGAAA